MNTKPTLIMMTGYAQSGKDTIGEYLVNEHGWTSTSFAATLKTIATRLHYWNGEKDNVGRVHLQHLGEVLRNELGEDVLIVGVENRILTSERPMIITDGRLPTEAAMIKRLGGQIWRVTRPGVGPANGHITETGLDGYDYDVTFHNDSDLGTLHRSVDRALACSSVTGTGGRP